ncbi:glycine dehydrogenase [Rhizophagus irregularis]|uniref:Glycine cleavage system P protein n=3 Tax=Rhizophagus irregularis TaxID=588596 RepID=U9UML1_RHIID|nr:glycine dehydrogenase [Rhizophagus irregularis DAOM 181602=DAOM 197198]EXX62240.1 glycine decarboxylase subunit P [Rhizophagus irregularis DAOM 197198w]PKC03200.1 glycine dehydrogenase [Rhizophagus irregularis]EXX62241.1 glycine decarboxylase subunit P [Rhizophagus irregularis DAOM 197198w]PKC66483.1 glycine dehydrogenase [Rhizophagus irregularis]PKK63200.1 glycine dehydrogenase [Rhizophagus irregularis]|eukprot:XP_025178071.1 glycine dehydrogenase [Rhizophagus irregularis DAOM 181602=DAOM 197198]
MFFRTVHRGTKPPFVLSRRIRTITTRFNNISVQQLDLNQIKSKKSHVSNFPKSFRKFSSTPLKYDAFSPLDTFPRRHNGPSDTEIKAMLETIDVKDMEELVLKTVPANIRSKDALALEEGLTESELMERLKRIASKNKVYKSYIGMGYANTIVPSVILRNILESPGWYTQYTPYQPEISQGRLESLLNFQTMVTDLTGMDLANASLLDEGTAAAEAMLISFSARKQKCKTFFVDERCHPQTIACLQTRSEGFGINVIVGDALKYDFENKHKNDLAGVLVQYPATDGNIYDYSDFSARIHSLGGQVVCATDLLALTLLIPPGEWGADIAVGNSQRFGVPLGYGGPHAAFFACKDQLKRRMPGRLVGVSRDASGNKAYRLSLQTREQHIRREKATSNICTAQALLANMAAMYAIYHGPEGITAIAKRIHNLTTALGEEIKQMGYFIKNGAFFDTLNVHIEGGADDIIQKALNSNINFRRVDNNTVGITLDETVLKEDVLDIIQIFSKDSNKKSNLGVPDKPNIPQKFIRTSQFMQHQVFNSYHSETEMLRYIYHLQSKDLSLAHSMIPLGSCTMKLNATTEMIPITWPEFANIHPFVPAYQAEGYKILIKELEHDLAVITGFDGISLQPNSGAQGEYTGLRIIGAYHKSKGDDKRNVCLIPVSAHGTNPASAAMAGMEVVPVKCENNGDLDMKDLEEKATKFKDRLAAFMVTYPSTFGVFESGVVKACEIIHQNGGQVYMDGANLNAQIGLCTPAGIGADVCHLNLHKTFCIPHGGGGPGVGPVGVKSHLVPFLPGHPVVKTGGDKCIGPVSAAPFGSPNILPISWAYIKMMGSKGLTSATHIALLNANYMAVRLSNHYKILYTNQQRMCAHEFIIDIRPFQKTAGIEAIDIAKRLQDYGFHSPTMSWPVANTLMVEPTESESKAELDRFCDAMISIREEIKSIENGQQPKGNNILTNSPHAIETLIKTTWDKAYSREQAAFPLNYLKTHKFWPSVGRLDDAFGDRNLICSCPPVEDYLEK